MKKLIIETKYTGLTDNKIFFSPFIQKNKAHFRQSNSMFDNKKSKYKGQKDNTMGRALILHMNNSSLILSSTFGFPKHNQEWYLSKELGVSFEYQWEWFKEKNKNNKKKIKTTITKIKTSLAQVTYVWGWVNLAQVTEERLNFIWQKLSKDLFLTFWYSMNNYYVIKIMSKKHKIYLP